MARQKKLPPGMWKRGNVYWARYRHNGRLVRKRLSTDLESAKTILTAERARLDRADVGLLDNDCPWSELRAEFLDSAKQTLRSAGEYESALERFEGYLKPTSVRQITTKVMIAYREWRLSQAAWGDRVSKDKRRTVSARTVNKEVGTIKTMLNKGVEWRRIRDNPIKDLKPLPHETKVKRRRSLTADEVEAIIAACPDYLLPVFRMYSCSGMRRNELVALRFSDVDLERQVVTIRAAVSKTKREREIPLDDDVAAMIAELKDGARHRKPVAGLTAAQTEKQAASFSRDHVFVSRANTPLKNNLLKRFYQICKKAGIEGAHPGGSIDIHAIRGTFATHSISNGTSPKEVQEMLGHRTTQMTLDLYAKATESGKRAAVNALPWAKSTAPAHVLTVRDAHKMSTVVKKSQKTSAKLG